MFEQLRERFGLVAPTAPDAIDHLLAGAWTWSSRRGPGRRSGASCARDGLALRLSDHAPVEARFATPDLRE